MPPNLKFPNNLPNDLAELQASLAQEQPPPAHAAPLATSSNTIPVAKDAKGDDYGYFHHDIEADQEYVFDSTKKQGANDMSTRNTRRSRRADEEVSEENEGRLLQNVIKKYSSFIQDPEEFTIDEKRLQRALKDAGTHAYGLQGIAVWVFDEDCDRLVAPAGGFWHHPANTEPSEALQLLVDASRSDHVPMIPVAPGTDIAGVLWLESNKRERVASFMQRKSSLAQLAGRLSVESFSALSRQHDETVLIWRDLNSLVQDPDTAKGPRMVLLESAGFGQATGIPFQTELCSGMVIFFVKRDLDQDILGGPSNVLYLRQAAQFIGSAAAMTQARRARLGHQLEKQQSSCRQHAISEETAAAPEQVPKEAPKKEALEKVSPSCFPSLRNIPRRMRVWLSKAHGGGLQIPPSLSLRQSLWTAFGAFVGLLVLSSLNQYYKYLSEDDYFLLIGPFGALMTLQYGLTAAPASQPRNAVMGQAVAGAVSLAFTYIPDDILPTWLRRAVGPAVAIATMVKFGFTHPPAGAHAVLYASGKYNFTFYALVVVSTAISVIPATLVNNMSRKRQYPTYWGFVLPTWADELFGSGKRKKEEQK